MTPGLTAIRARHYTTGEDCDTCCQHFPCDAARVLEAYEQLSNEYSEALHCVLMNKRLPNGEYVHHIICNTKRTNPIGIKGVTCNCKITSRERAEHAEADLATLRGLVEPCQRLVDRVMLLRKAAIAGGATNIPRSEVDEIANALAALLDARQKED